MATLDLVLQKERRGRRKNKPEKCLFLCNFFLTDLKMSSEKVAIAKPYCVIVLKNLRKQARYYSETNIYNEIGFHHFTCVL